MASGQPPPKGNFDVLPHNLTVAKPSPNMMRQIPVFSTTCSRWIEILEICKERRINLLGGVANTLLGIFLAAMVPAISEIASQNKFSLSPWIAVAMLALVGAVVSGAAYWQVGTYERGSLNTMLGELRELKSRFDGEGDRTYV
jgi:hypothetical protein